MPLLPWVYRLWDAGFLVPLVGASGKDSNRAALGGVRTYAQCRADSWVETVRAGRTFVSAGPLLDLHREGERIRAVVRVREAGGKLELIANGEVLAATDQTEFDAAVPSAGWVAARFSGPHGFAHTSPIAVGELARREEALASCANWSNRLATGST